jgi:two-component system, NtrC family, C4-dicarboxylate transport sensor histidine kinase DctB
MSPPSRWRETVVSAFWRWVRAQDTREVLGAATVRAWLSLGVAVTVLLALTAWVPGARQFFGLPFLPTLLYFVPAFALGLTFALAHRGRRHLEWWGWLLILLGTASLHFFMASLMALATLKGATVFAGLLLLVTTAHGRMHRVTLGQPFLCLGTALALALAALLSRSQQHLALFAVVGLCAVVGQLYLGTFALQHDQTLAEAERLRAAVQAQMLEQQEKDVGRLSQALVQILGYNHDINNALMSASAAADMLAVMGVQRNNLARADFVDLVRELNDSLTRIRDMVLEIRQKGKRSVGADPENVDLVPVLESVRTSLRWRFPDVHIQVKVEGTPLRASVRGGVITLRRVVENLVLNACEGNGEKGAARVDITARTEPYSGRLEVLIADDGPGFAADRLASPIEGLSTSKPNGTGLGLYTSECLIRASGGTLERSNRPTGGAQLRILLPQELR